MHDKTAESQSLLRKELFHQLAVERIYHAPTGPAFFQSEAAWITWRNPFSFMGILIHL